MSSRIGVTIDDGTGDEFDERLARFREAATFDGGDLAVVSKRAGTASGRPCVMLTFTVERGGELFEVQTVTSLVAFLAAADVLRAAHARELLAGG